MMLIKLNKKVLITVFCLILVIIAGAVHFAFNRENNVIETMAEITNWGLSFQNEGKAPIGNLKNEELKKYNAVFLGDESEKKIYLTFDAGYENGYTEKILDALKEADVKATFFIVGNYLETAPDLVKRMYEEGHIVANHTYSHPDMSKILDENAFKEELNYVEKLYKEITGAEMEKYYRPPQGKFSIDNLNSANKMGYKTIFWSLAYVDWYNDDQPTKEEAFDKLLNRIHPGCILLLHSTSKTNSEILPELISKYKEMGYSFASLDELFN